MKKLAPVAVLAAVTAIATRLLAQAPNATALLSGTASVSGIVVAADSGAPVPRAAVVLGGATFPGFRTVTDTEGRFVFERLPAGQFTVRASKPGFLAMAFGQDQPGRGAGLPLELKPGETLGDLRWSLPRGAALTGRVLDHTGQPMLGAVVAAVQRRLSDGEPVLRSCCGQTRTDPNGFYRIGELMPGSYAVAVLPPAEYRFLPEVLSSFGNETREVTDAEIQWALRELSNAASGRVPTVPPAPEPPRGRTVSHGRLFYPGTSDPTGATMVTLKAGEERAGLDVTMVLQPTATIRARVVGPDGQPATNASVSFSDGWSTSTAALAPDATFERRNLLPGRYTVTVRSRSAALYASRTIDLAGADATDVVLTLGPAASLRGRVVFEPGEPAIDLSAVRVTVTLAPLNGTAPVRVGADGTFSFPLVDPGRYRLSAAIPAANRGAWSLKSATIGGADALDTQVVIEAGQSIDDVLVTFTTRTAGVSGTLSTAEGTPAAGYYVVLFADDPAQWSPRTQRVPPAARASTDGRFAFRGLPAGTYRLAALTSVDDSDLSEPDFLAALKASALAVTLAEGEAKVQDLRFARR